MTAVSTAARAAPSDPLRTVCGDEVLRAAH